jgi:hypothetical protein
MMLRIESTAAADSSEVTAVVIMIRFRVMVYILNRECRSTFSATLGSVVTAVQPKKQVFTGMRLS